MSRIYCVHKGNYDSATEICDKCRVAMTTPQSTPNGAPDGLREAIYGIIHDSFQDKTERILALLPPAPPQTGEALREYDEAFENRINVGYMHATNSPESTAAETRYQAARKALLCRLVDPPRETGEEPLDLEAIQTALETGYRFAQGTSGDRRGVRDALWGAIEHVAEIRRLRSSPRLRISPKLCDVCLAPIPHERVFCDTCNPKIVPECQDKEESPRTPTGDQAAPAAPIGNIEDAMRFGDDVAVALGSVCAAGLIDAETILRDKLLELNKAPAAGRPMTWTREKAQAARLLVLLDRIMSAGRDNRDAIIDEMKQDREVFHALLARGFDERSESGEALAEPAPPSPPTPEPASGDPAPAASPGERPAAAPGPQASGKADPFTHEDPPLPPGKTTEQNL